MQHGTWSIYDSCALLTENSWACVKLEEIVAADPDVMIVVDASFDPAMDKIDFMHNHSDFCNATWSQAAPLSPSRSSPPARCSSGQACAAPQGGPAQLLRAGLSLRVA